MLNLTNEKAQNFIAFLMGGRCAEEIVFNEITNGASNDIERATQLAHDMVCNWGMSKELGTLTLKKSGLSPFGNNDQAIDFSDQTSRKIDDEVSRLVKDNYKLAIKILEDNRDALDRLAEALSFGKPWMLIRLML